ncbi:MAG TPA: hypothetical protein VLI92_04855 [Candidatus Saccharimonadales bacterium]|nr:hypothetical protein [Candidatus Saccharimonadales bacterium]
MNTQTSAGVNHGKFDSAWVIPTDNDYLLVTLNTTAPYHNVVTYQSFTTGQTVTTSLWTAYEAIYSDGQFFAVRNPYGGIDLGEVHGDGSVTTEHIGFDPDLQTWQLQAGKLLALKVVSAGHNQQSRVRAYGTFEQFGNGTYNVFTNTYWLTDTTGLAAPQLDVTSQKESLSPNGSQLYYYWLKDVGDPNGQSECRIASIDSALTVTHVVDSGGSYSECPGSKPLWYGEDNLYIKGYPYSAWNIPGDTWNHSLPDLGDDYTSFSYAQTDPTNNWILYFLPTMGSWAAFVPGVNSMLHLEMWGGVALHRVMIALPNP